MNMVGRGARRLSFLAQLPAVSYSAASDRSTVVRH